MIEADTRKVVVTITVKSRWLSRFRLPFDHAARLRSFEIVSQAR